MMKSVLEYVPENYKKSFFDNVQSFKDAWEEENSIRASIRKNDTSLVPVLIEKCDSSIDLNVRESVLNIYRALPHLVPPVYENKFKKSLSNSNSILITLRVNDKDSEIVGYVKGGPLETYELRRGIRDSNVGK